MKEKLNPLEAEIEIAEKEIAFCTFRNAKDNNPQQRSMTWTEIKKQFFSRHHIREVKDGPTYSPVSYKPGGKRGVAGVEAVYCAVFDVEHHGSFDAIAQKLYGYAYVAHSSHSHTLADPRFRIVLPLDAPVAADDWPPAWAKLNQWLGDVNDRSTKDASRIYYLPSRPSSSKDHFIRVGEGRPLCLSQLPQLPPELGTQAVRRRVVSKTIDGLEDIPPEPLSPADGLARVVSRCKFMEDVSRVQRQPTVSRPLWMAMVSNASRFEASDEWIHKGSCHHEKYDEVETAKMIESCRNFQGGPITCQKIREDGYVGCPTGGCKTKNGNVTGAPAGLWMGASRSAAERLKSEYSVGSFDVSDRGVESIRFKDGEIFRVPVATRIDVLAQTVASNQTDWGYLLSIRDPNGKENQFHLPRSMLTNKPLWQSELLKRGASIYGTADNVYSYLMACDEVVDRVVSVSQPGWALDVDGERIFVLPGQIIHAQAKEVRALLQDEDAAGRLAFARAGSLEDWRAKIAGPASGNSRLTFAISVAFTGPLLSLLNVEGGGFHIVGESSSGKTTAVEVAATVWGGPGFVQQWRLTSNAFESIAGRHNDTLLVLDEINQASAEDAGEIAYMLGNGRGKTRANRDATARKVATWRLVSLSTGEKSLAEHLQSADAQAMAGHEVRMVSFPGDAGVARGVFEDLHGLPTPQAFADSLKESCTQVFGTAGAKWVQAILTSDLKQLTAEVWADVNRFEAANVPADAAPQVRRIARRFALVGAAGEAAIRSGVLPWSEGEALTGARACFRSWLADRGGVENQEERQAVAQIRRFLEQHGESRFTAWDEIGDAPGVIRTVNRVGFRKVADDGRTDYLVLTEAYKTELCANLNSKDVTKVLRTKGLLVLDPDGGSTRKERLPGLGSTRVYRIKADIFNMDEG
ncbi:DUF927 domain-containing protein [Caenimonas sp. SL110]|uniref:DUF927 domain-containing protein n=1 Tax=Caenimonas sp. SL110 TaxID=1450524 RepID=UPI00069F438B|nr:DUF927 domain-containing protein [Caenimonas sp. SL110]